MRNNRESASPAPEPAATTEISPPPMAAPPGESELIAAKTSAAKAIQDIREKLVLLQHANYDVPISNALRDLEQAHKSLMTAPAPGPQVQAVEHAEAPSAVL